MRRVYISTAPHGKRDGRRLHKNVGRELPKLADPSDRRREASVLAIEEQPSRENQNPALWRAPLGLRNLPGNLPRLETARVKCCPFLIGIRGFVTGAFFQGEDIIKSCLWGRSRAPQFAASLGTPRGVLHHRPSGPMPEAQSTRCRKGLAKSNPHCFDPVHKKIHHRRREAAASRACLGSGIYQYIGFRRIFIQQIMRRELVMPFQFPGSGIESKNAMKDILSPGRVRSSWSAGPLPSRVCQKRRRRSL